MLQPQYKTRNWVLTCSILFQVIVFIVAFLLFCQTDLLNFDWIVPHGATLWSGRITSVAQLNRLNERYQADFVETMINDGMIHGVRNIGAPIVSINVLYIVLISFAFTILLVLVLKCSRIANWDVSVFALSANCGFVLAIFADLIPVWDHNNDFVRIVAVIAIMLVGVVVVFLLLNMFYIKNVIKGKYAFDFAKDIINENNQIKYQDDDFKSLIKKKEEEKNYIEIEK